MKISPFITTPRYSPPLPLIPSPWLPVGSSEPLLAYSKVQGLVNVGVRARWMGKMECPADNVNKHTWLLVVVPGDVTTRPANHNTQLALLTS